MSRTARVLLVLILLGLAGGVAEPGHAGCSPSYTIGDHAPLWSPTGEWIVFDRHDTGCGMPAFLTSVRADGTSETRLLPYGRQRVEWTDDGTAVLGFGLVLVAPDAHVLRPPEPKSGSSAAAHPSFSPDGSQIVFQQGFPARVYLADANGARQRALTTGSAAYAPIWSPRGDLIAFGVNGGVDVIRPEGSGRREVWRGVAAGGVSWSPDGSMLAFLVRSNPRYSADELWIVDVDRGSSQRVLAEPFVEHAPAWRPDGALIAVTRSLSHEAREIVTVRPDGRGEHTFGPGSELSWSRDGARVAYVWNGRCPWTRLGLYVANADGNEPRRLTNDCRFEGGTGADVLRGTADDDLLFGRAGADVLTDGYGEDFLDGGDGDDRLAGGEQADRLAGGRGDDVVAGGGGRDVIYGGPGRDRVGAGIAKDVIYVGDGEPDVVACGPQLDVVFADPGDRIARDCEDVRIAR